MLSQPLRLVGWDQILPPYPSIIVVINVKNTRFSHKNKNFSGLLWNNGWPERTTLTETGWQFPCEIAYESPVFCFLPIYAGVCCYLYNITRNTNYFCQISVTCTFCPMVSSSSSRIVNMIVTCELHSCLQFWPFNGMILFQVAVHCVMWGRNLARHTFKGDIDGKSCWTSTILS